MSEAVRRALEAACRTDPMYGATPGGDADIRRDRADAIAAFLCALPDYYGGDTLNLAAEVTAAAEAAAKGE